MTAFITPAFAISKGLPRRSSGRVPRRASAMVGAALAAVVVAALLPVVDSVSSSSPPAQRQPAAAAGPAVPTAADALARARARPRFEANRGQFDPEVRFVSRAGGYSLFLTATGATMAMGDTTGDGPDSGGAVVRMALVGANPDPQMSGGQALGGVSNYLSGNDATKWVTGVPAYATVRYHGVYPGIDLVYHSDDQGRVEYDFVVAPGADPAAIAMDYSGAKGLRLEAGGGLVVATAGGELRQHKPTLYQHVAGGRREVPGSFVVEGERVRFAVGAYDASVPLVIDPVLSFSTYLGGNANDEATGIAVDRAGFAYVVGTTASSAFPTTAGADRTCGSGEGCTPLSDGYVVPRVSGLPTGNTLQSSVVTTRTPRSTPRPDAFVTKLDPNGDVVYSTYLGGSGADEGLAIAVDGAGRAYVAGRTKSVDFPTTANAFDRSCGSEVVPLSNVGTCDFRLTDDVYDGAHGQTKADAFVTKLDHTGGLDVAKRAYSTYFGGSGDDTRAGYSFFYTAPDGSGPGDEIEHGRLNDGGASVVSPYRGASAAIAVSGETVYLASSTTSTDLIKAPGAPATAAGYRPARVGPDTDCGTDGTCNEWGSQCSGDFCEQVQLFSDVFVAQLDTTRAAPQALGYATYLGGSEDDVARGIAAHTDGAGTTRLHVVSTTEKGPCPRGGGTPADGRAEMETDFNRCRMVCSLEGLGGCLRLPLPGDFPSSPPTKVTLDNLVTLLPQQSGESSEGWTARLAGRALGVAVDDAGRPHVTGQTRGALVTTTGAFQPHHVASWDAFVARFSPGGAVDYATYLGGTGAEAGHAVAVDEAGRVFVTGETNSFDNTANPANKAFPTRDPVQATPTQSTRDAFVAALDPARPGDGGLVYSTYLGGRIAAPAASDGGDHDDVGRAIALGPASAPMTSVYVSGRSRSRDFPLVNPHSDVNTGGSEAFVARLGPGGPLPVVSGVSVATGPASGGTAVEVRGSHLRQASSVAFGAQTLRCPSTSCEVVDDATLRVTSPPLFSDTSDTAVDIVVAGPGGASVRSPSSVFTYVDGSWGATTASSVFGAGSTATVLDGSECTVGTRPSYCGKVLVVKGAEVDLYDPTTGKWASQSCVGAPTSMNCPEAPGHDRSGHTATLLANGTVLFVGGAASAMAQLYHPGSGMWSDAGELGINRKNHTATLLASGKVLVVGGSANVPPRGTNDVENARNDADALVDTPHTSAELYDPVGSPKWSHAGNLRGARYEGHTATLLTGTGCGLNCGKVVVIGGRAAMNPESVDGDPAQALVEIYDPAAVAAAAFSGEAGGLARIGHTATALHGPGCSTSCGKVVVAGGYGGRREPRHLSVELYDPAVADVSEAFSLHSRLRTGRVHHAAVALTGARVLLIGGQGGDPRAFLAAIGAEERADEVYDPAFEAGRGGWRPGPRGERSGPAVLLKGPGSAVVDARCEPHCAKVLTARDGAAATNTAGLYTPAPLAHSITPATGLAGGGITVSITGAGLDGGADTGVYFGTSKVCGRGAPRACEGVTYSTVATISPAVADQASAPVWVSRHGVGIVRVPRAFDYTGPPGPVAPFDAVAMSNSVIELVLGGAGSVGTGNPVVKDYIVKQSRSPIDAANFDAAPALCAGGVCRLEFAEVGQTLPLTVTGLRSGTQYYYAARAQKSGSTDRLGPIAFADATTTGLAPDVSDPPPGPDLGEVADQVLYRRGYSLVGLPEATVVASQSPLYGWVNQGATNAHGQPSTYSTQAPGMPVAGGHGYWAWFSAPQAVKLSGPGVAAMDLALGAYRASMVGNPSGTAVSTVSGHDYTARWDPALNGGAGGYHLSGYQQAQDLAVGEGIWAFSYADTTLRLRAK